VEVPRADLFSRTSVLFTDENQPRIVYIYIYIRVPLFMYRLQHTRLRSS